MSDRNSDVLSRRQALKLGLGTAVGLTVFGLSAKIVVLVSSAATSRAASSSSGSSAARRRTTSGGNRSPARIMRESPTAAASFPREGFQSMLPRRPAKPVRYRSR